MIKSILFFDYEKSINNIHILESEIINGKQISEMMGLYCNIFDVV